MHYSIHSTLRVHRWFVFLHDRFVNSPRSVRWMANLLYSPRRLCIPFVMVHRKMCFFSCPARNKLCCFQEPGTIIGESGSLEQQTPIQFLPHLTFSIEATIFQIYIWQKPLGVLRFSVSLSQAVLSLFTLIHGFKVTMLTPATYSCKPLVPCLRFLFA